MRAHAAVLIACILASPAKSNAEQPAPPLDAIRAKILNYLANIPRYTCTETIERRRFQADSDESESRDRIRLEMIIAGGQAIVAWPGASHFEDKDIRELIQKGTTAKGDFGGFVLKVIAGDSKYWTGSGQEEFQGRSVLRFGFEVQEGDHAWLLKVGDQAGYVAFRGSVFLDAATLELVHLERQMLNIPARFGVADVHSAIESQSSGLPETGRQHRTPLRERRPHDA